MILSLKARDHIPFFTSEISIGYFDLNKYFVSKSESKVYCTSSLRRSGLPSDTPLNLRQHGSIVPIRGQLRLLATKADDENADFLAVSHDAQSRAVEVKSRFQDPYPRIDRKEDVLSCGIFRSTYSHLERNGTLEAETVTLRGIY